MEHHALLELIASNQQLLLSALQPKDQTTTQPEPADSNTQLKCGTCQDIAFDPVAMTCCGTVHCLWCLDPGLPVGLSTPLTQCPNADCCQPIRKLAVCPALDALAKKGTSDAVLAQQRQARTTAFKLLHERKIAAERYVNGERYRKLLQLAGEILREPREMAFLTVTQFEQLLVEKLQAALEPTEIECVLRSIDVLGHNHLLWCRGDLIALRADVYREPMIKARLFAELFTANMIHMLDGAAEHFRIDALNVYAGYCDDIDWMIEDLLKEPQPALSRLAIVKLATAFAYKLEEAAKQLESESCSSASTSRSSSASSSSSRRRSA